jgi:AraC-like DNA-binding protein
VQRHVGAALGLSPKRWLLVGRFKQALRRVALGRERLVEIALDAGYADQAHLTTDMKRLAGTTPGRLRRSELRELAPEAVPFLRDESLRRRLQLVLSPAAEGGAG